MTKEGGFQGVRKRGLEERNSLGKVGEGMSKSADAKTFQEDPESIRFTPSQDKAEM